MNFDLHNRVALVVGGTSGIGLATAQLLIAEGAQVVIAGRNQERGREAARQLGGGACYASCDIAEEGSLEEVVQDLVAQKGRLDIAVNSAASAPFTALLHETGPASAKALLDTDMLGQFNCLKAEIAAMLKTGGGSIVNVASINGLSGSAGAALYSAGRHALVGLTRSAAREVIGHNIRINAVCPGPTDTPRREQRLMRLTPAEREKLIETTKQHIPIGRPARAAEIAAAIVWLASPLASYVVGHCLVVDGGISA